jgi:hypothetical protein
MIGQDLTKLTCLLVILGCILAVAIFRPPILSARTGQAGKAQETPSVPGQVEPNQPQSAADQREAAQSQRQADLDARESALNQRQVELDQRQADLDTREATSNQRQAGLDQREADLNQHQADLEARETTLNQRQTGLDQREADLNQRQTDLDVREAALNQRQDEQDQREAILNEQIASQQATEARLQRWQANLAEQGQKLEGFLRWSVVAVVVSSLMAVPSVWFLVALGRQNQRMTGRKAQRTQASQPHQWKRVTQYGGLKDTAPVPTYGDNGRGKESVSHRI